MIEPYSAYPSRTPSPPPRSRVALPLEHALHGAVTARRAASRFRRSSLAEPLLQLAAELEAALPPTVPQLAAARAFGVSPEALRRWIQRGELPLVEPRPGALPGIPTDVVLDVVERIEALRARGRQGRLLERALGDRAGRPARTPRVTRPPQS